MNCSRIIKDYLTFNRMEQRGLFVLALILFGLLIVTIFIPAFIKGKPVDFSPYSREITAFENAVRNADSMANRTKNKKHQFNSGKYLLPVADSSSLKHFKPVENLVIELNKADTFELQRLRGIGPGFAYRIIKYRDRLGGFVSKTQVMEVFGMDSLRFSGISDHIVADRSLVHPIDLNNVTFKEMLAHPYFPFEITKAIMLYRKEHKLIRDPDELKLIHGIDEVLFQKIRPYIFVK
jgi:DNA uptake protein ComE-like DNA-binding protein